MQNTSITSQYNNSPFPVYPYHTAISTDLDIIHLPEKNSSGGGVNHASMGCGLWVLCGFLVFIIAEKMFSTGSDDQDDEAEPQSSGEQKYDNNNCAGPVELCKRNRVATNGDSNGLRKEQQPNGLRKLGNGVKGCNGYANGFGTKGNGVKLASNGFCGAREAENKCGEEFFFGLVESAVELSLPHGKETLSSGLT